MIRQLLSPRHSYFSFGIICGRLWGSLAVEDHLRSILGIICGLGISCGWGSFSVLYSTPQCPPLYNLDNLWSMSSVLHRVIKLPPVKWVRMSLEESLINMVSSLNIQFSKPIGTGATHVRYAKYEILSFMVDFSDCWRVALGLIATHFFLMNLI